jgi:hypothetical protein
MQTLLNISPRKLFLLDTMGAALSAFLLGVVLPHFERHIGMPLMVLYLLSTIACVFVVYSFIGYLLVKENQTTYLKIIAFANLLYCCLTAGLTFYYAKELTTLGVLYFIGEIALILGLVTLELKTALNPAHANAA